MLTWAVVGVLSDTDELVVTLVAAVVLTSDKLVAVLWGEDSALGTGLLVEETASGEVESVASVEVGSGAVDSGAVDSGAGGAVELVGAGGGALAAAASIKEHTLGYSKFQGMICPR